MGVKDTNKSYQTHFFSGLRYYSIYCNKCSTYHIVGRIPNHISKEQRGRYVDETLKRRDNFFIVCKNKI